MRQIGNYIVEDVPLGSGGMGQVLKGTTADGRTPVAIKEILPNFVQDVEYRARIESEINFLKKLNNPNVVKVFDHFEIDGKLYIVMELVEGMNIEQFVAANGKVAWQDAVKYMIGILRAMQDVHEHGIVHRDIKPGNIMIRPNGEICLLDFGVAKDVSNSAPFKPNMTVWGTVIGTDGYMSPEQASGLSIDHRSDIYALGCVLYFMVTGTHAFGNEKSELGMQRAISQGVFPRLTDKVKGLPSSLQNVLDHAVEKNMMKRIQSCREFANELADVLPVGTAINTAVGADTVKVSVGRQNCDICIGVENMKVSRHHADIQLRQFTGGEFYIYTDCSSNGTLIDGKMYRQGMTYNIPKGEFPEILLAGDPGCRVDMNEVASLLEAKKRKAIEAENALTGRGKNKKDDKKTDNNSGSSKETISFIEAIKNCVTKTNVYKGRASRAEFWWSYLFLAIIYTIIAIVFIASGYNRIVEWIVFSLCAALLISFISVGVRRLHDIGKSGAWMWLSLVPIANLVLLVFWVTPGSPETNKYGAPVK